MNKIKNWFDDILWIIEDVISIILFIIWFTIFICIPLIISPEDEAMFKEDYDLAKRLEKNN